MRSRLFELAYGDVSLYTLLLASASILVGTPIVIIPKGSMRKEEWYLCVCQRGVGDENILRTSGDISTV